MKLREELKQVLHYTATATDDQLVGTLLKLANKEFEAVWSLFREACEYRNELNSTPGYLMMSLPIDAVGELQMRASIALGEAWEILPEWILRYAKDLYECGRTERYSEQLLDRNVMRAKVDQARRLNALNADYSAVLADRLNDVTRSVSKAKVGK